MTIEQVTDAGRQVIALRREYWNRRVGHREMSLDPILYAYMQGRFGRMSRQHRVQMHGRVKPCRIDFRHGGPGPAVIEFAVRSPSGQGSLTAGANRTELRKLTRVTRTSTALRALLLIDLSKWPIARGDLKPGYDSLSAGPGNFTRHSVRVVYVHAELDYHFIWWPEAC